MATQVLQSCTAGKAARKTADTQPRVYDTRGLKMSPYRVRGKRYVPMTVSRALAYKAEGIASYYDAPSHRRYFGKRYRKGDFYAAHPTLPLPSVIRVTDPQSGKSCLADVIERGPFNGRVVDVSSGIARYLGFYRAGLRRVHVEVISVGKYKNPEANSPAS